MMTMNPIKVPQILLGLTFITCSLFAFIPEYAFAHEIGGRDAAFVAGTNGPAPGPFLYLGAKHMVTGIDHLLFLLGVIFFLSRPRDILVYVSLFSLGHSITLLSGVLLNVGLNASLVDAAIGLSVVYKAFDNLGGFGSLKIPTPNARWAVFGFGLVHGLGLSSKLIELDLNPDGLLVNLVSFNIGVEIGQGLALLLVLVPLLLWRARKSFSTFSGVANWVMMAAGFTLIGFHLASLFLETTT